MSVHVDVGAGGLVDRAELGVEAARPVFVFEAGATQGAAYSFGYAAHWSGGDPQAVKDSAERVVTTARTILDRTGVLTEPATTSEPMAA